MKKKRSPDPPPTEPRLETLRLADLIPHPDQELYFPVYDEHRFEELVRSVRAKGVETPPDVLPAGNTARLPGNTILCGHTRAKAAREAGLTSIPVRVRYDLLGASRAAVDEVFLGDNTLRRQLSKLGEARAAVGIYLARKAQAGKTVRGSVFADQSLRDQVGAIIGMSGRNLGRYLNVLEAPLEVQLAFERNQLKLVDAARVANLPRNDQERFAARLHAGDDPKAVFAAFFPPKGRGHASANNAVAAFARSLEAAGANITDRLEEVKAGVVRQNKEQLRAGGKLIKDLLQKLDRAG